MSRGKSVNFSVDARSCKNNADRMIRRFLKKTKKTRIVEEFRDRQYYKKPSEAKKAKRIRAQRVRLREEKKRQKRNRNRN
jgi:ribosomal protein S21